MITRIISPGRLALALRTGVFDEETAEALAFAADVPALVRATVARDFRLQSLLPWFFRQEPVRDPLLTPSLGLAYQAATVNLQRADASMLAPILLMYSSAAALDKEIATNEIQTVYEIGLRGWNTIGMKQPLFAAGIEASLSSYIVQAWTAFETFATDVWVAALNAHPVGLSNLHGRRGDSESSKSDRSVPLHVLNEHGFDLSHCMGTLLAQRRGFDTLEKIRASYRLAFYKGFDSGDVALNDEAFDALSLVRNIFVHRSGIADAEYVRKANTLPLAPDAAIGDMVRLDGDVVVNLLQATYASAVALFLAVDRWLAEY